MFRYSIVFRRSWLLTAAFAVCAANSMAGAQETGMQPALPGPNQVTSSPEVVIITPVRHGPSRSTVGAPIEDVSLSASVRTDDLNLQSPADIMELRDRVWQTARRLCDRLEFQYPISTPQGYWCVKKAVNNTNAQIDAAIHNYRSPTVIENP
jgi:UrcA family protein